MLPHKLGGGGMAMVKRMRLMVGLLLFFFLLPLLVGQLPIHHRGTKIEQPEVSKPVAYAATEMIQQDMTPSLEQPLRALIFIHTHEA